MYVSVKLNSRPIFPSNDANAKTETLNRILQHRIYKTEFFGQYVFGNSGHSKKFQKSQNDATNAAFFNFFSE